MKKYVTESTNNIATEFFKRATRSVVENHEVKNVNESTQKSKLTNEERKKVFTKNINDEEFINTLKIFSLILRFWNLKRRG